MSVDATSKSPAFASPDLRARPYSNQSMEGPIAGPPAIGNYGPADAARVVRAVFPRYYLLGIVCGLILCSLLVLRRDGPRLAAVISFTLIDLYCRQVLTPRINEARDAGPTRQTEFDRMHRLSVQLNGVVMLGLVGFFVWAVIQKPPL